MSRNSQAKKARRKKRQATRAATWIPAGEFDQMLDDEEHLDALDAAIGDIDDWLTPRGWVLDSETTENTGLMSWFYPPSAVEVDDPDLEPVTRLWINLTEDDEEVLLEFGCLLVGFGSEDEPRVLDPDRFAEDIPVIEAYRFGMPRALLG